VILKRLCVLGCLLLFSLPAAAQDLKGSCAIRFFGDSTLHAFDGTGACEPFVVTIEGEPPERRVVPAQVDVSVAGLDTDNASRDKKMRGMFDSAHYPRIVGRFKQLDPDALLAAWQESPDGKLQFELQIRDVTQPVEARVSNLKVSNDRISFTLDFSLSLKSYQLDPPGVLGIIRVADTVRVEVDVAYEGSVTVATGREG